MEICIQASKLPNLASKIKAGGPLVLWHGSLGTVSATFVGHYPWFFTRNQLQEILPKYDREKETLNYLVRSITKHCYSAPNLTCFSTFFFFFLFDHKNLGCCCVHWILLFGCVGHLLQLDSRLEDDETNLRVTYHLRRGVQQCR